MAKRWFPALMMILAVLAGRNASATVWDTTQQWSAEWEQRYHDWVRTTWDENYFVRPGIYQGIIFDCADAVYSMRFVFAAENGLPFAVRDNTGGNRLITNEMSRFDRLQPDQRKRAFLIYIAQVTGTHSLPLDTYPVAANRDAIGSGRVLITDKASHHSWTIKYVADTGVPYLIFSTRPARTKFLRRFQFPTKEFVFPNGVTLQSHAGFRAFRWPEHELLPEYQVPGFSMEQYQIPFAAWTGTMQRRLQVRDESFQEKLTRMLANACVNAKERATIVKQGVEEASKIGDACMSPQEFDDYSTPSRDFRMKGDFQELLQTYRQAVKANAKLDPQTDQRMQSVLSGDRGVVNGGFAFCPVEVMPGTTMTLGQIYARSVGGLLSSNPNDDWQMRWGLAAFPSQKALSCPSY